MLYLDFLLLKGMWSFHMILYWIIGPWRKPLGILKAMYYITLGILYMFIWVSYLKIWHLVEFIFITCFSIFEGIRMQLFSFAGQIFQFKTLDCSTIRCNTLELSIASKTPDVYVTTNNTLNLIIEDFGIFAPNNHSFISSIGYSESCCQYVTFFRHHYE